MNNIHPCFYIWWDHSQFSVLCEVRLLNKIVPDTYLARWSVDNMRPIISPDTGYPASYPVTKFLFQCKKLNLFLFHLSPSHSANSPFLSIFTIFRCHCSQYLQFYVYCYRISGIGISEKWYPPNIPPATRYQKRPDIRHAKYSVPGTTMLFKIWIHLVN